MTVMALHKHVNPQTCVGQSTPGVNVTTTKSSVHALCSSRSHSFH